MIPRLAVDTNAVVAWFRSGNGEPRPLRDAGHLALLLPVIGELYFGAFTSRKRDANVALLEEFIAQHRVVNADETTARLYGQLRARPRLDNIRTSKMNDLWIAALCIQHDLPLLTNDRGFDTIDGLNVIHW